MICVLVLAAGEPWETTLLQEVERQPDLMVLRRCMDIADLLAAAGTGQAQAAVVALTAPGFDATAVQDLADAGVQCLGVAEQPERDDVLVRVVRIGLETVVGTHDLHHVPGLLRELPDEASGVGTTTPPERPGHAVVTVWGPAGAPGRSTLAAALATEISRRERHVTLVDADPCAPSLAQLLGLLEDSSGLVAAARSVGAGQLGEQLPRHLRRIGTHLDVLTGLPRPDRWNEVRGESLVAVLEAAAVHGPVVVDTGASLEETPDQRVGRNTLSVESVRRADDLVVVGTPDPVGLTRLVHALGHLREQAGEARIRVAINRMRPGVGWSQTDVRDLLGPWLGDRPVHFLPEDRAGADRALLAGRSVVEVGHSALAQAVARLVDDLPCADAGAAGSRRRRRFGIRR